MRGRSLVILATTLLALTMPSRARATLIHDVETTPTYSNEFGVRLKDLQGELLEGISPTFNKYSGDLNVKFKLKNIGNFLEEVSPRGYILNASGSTVYSWDHSDTTLTEGQYKYREKNIDFSALENGAYTIRVGAELEGDMNPSNNYRTRQVQVIPEPSTLVLMGLGATAISRRKRK